MHPDIITQLAYVGIALAAAFVGWVSVVFWNDHVTQRDARERRDFDMRETLADVTLWDDCRSQLEGASVTREAYPWSRVGTCQNAASCLSCDEAFQCEPEE